MSDSERPSRPLLRPGLAIIAMEQAVQLRAGDEEVFLLHTDAPDQVVSVLRMLDGDCALEDVLAVFGDGASGTKFVGTVIDELVTGGLLLDGCRDEFDSIGQYFAHFANQPLRMRDELRRCRVATIGGGDIVRLIGDLLGEYDVASTTLTIDGLSRGIDCDVMVCAWEQPDLSMVYRVNALVCRALPCMFVDLSHGRHATVGPFYLPGESSCYRCLRSRLYENTVDPSQLGAADETMLTDDAALPAYGTLPAHRHQVAAMACQEVVAKLTGHRALRTINRAITVDFEQMKTWSEPVWRVPWCEDCGATG